jgi:hypothetical protein
VANATERRVVPRGAEENGRHGREKAPDVTLIKKTAGHFV